MKRTQKMQAQGAKVTTARTEAQNQSVEAEQLLIELEDRDERRALRSERLGDRLPGRQ